MNVDEMSDTELEQKRQDLHADIYGHLTCYSTTDLRQHEAVLQEMHDRGLGVTPIQHRDEDKNVNPNIL